MKTIENFTGINIDYFVKINFKGVVKMSRDKVSLKMDVDTQTKIKNAARLMFHRKGFAATRTRDIAEEAGINLALLNYYFRSKQKLFDIIMMETMQSFFQAMAVFDSHL